ncbi:MAG: Methyltransferase [Candidatus Ozemobacter sibiricus]|jgi:SAM-dependent methyltransferase|uniref:Methyltransferase n=1 Tax=Candidatus Ozemobacter sibiricus TaxID=2268124 RepID=A0A367ZJP3_9BACT|nr:MAG: Methyltransferase [Candidatus Ozemobacter sibiricus]
MKATNEPLGVGELIHDGVIYDKMNTSLEDLPFYTKWVRLAAGPALELCCGTGRLLLPLVQAGLPVTGLDFTPSMLERARAKARQAGLAVDLIEGDMRRFDLGRRFALVYIPFNSLQNTYTRADLEAIFACVHRHLAPEGRFIVDVFNPDLRLMIERARDFCEIDRFRLDDGRECIVAERCHYDAATQVNRVTWRFRLGDDVHDQKLDMRCFYPEELDALLAYNGFRVLHKFGHYDERPFASDAPKQICVCAPLADSGHAPFPPPTGR